MATETDKVKRVLIVEDDAAAREATGLYLEYCGYEVVTAADAKAAYAEALLHEPTLLICDWQLGAGENGVSIARRLQSRYGTPIIFMTAHPLDELYGETDDLDVYRYLKKPLSLGELAEAVAEIHYH